MNENLGELYAALAAARQEFGKLNKSKAVNTGTYSYSYADLSDIIEATASALAEQGLVVIQDPEVAVDGGRSVVVVHGCIAHKSGAVHQLMPLSMPVIGGTAQAIGSAISYARRYQIQAALNLAAEDDDGEAASKATQTPQDARKQMQPSNHTAPPTKTPQRPTTQPTAHIDDAEPVDPDGVAVDNPFAGEPPDIPQRGQPITESTLKRLHAIGAKLYGKEWDAKRPEQVQAASKGAVTSSKDLTENEARTLAAILDARLARQQQADSPLKAAA